MIAGRARAPPTLVIGDGPVASAAAIVLAREREVCLGVASGARHPARIDALPLHILGALIELGVHPASFGVSEGQDTTLSAWATASPEAMRGFPKAHVDRTLLDAALLERAWRTPGVVVKEGACSTDFERLVDCTGRRSLTAVSVHRPGPTWVARTRLFEGRFSPAGATFRIAAIPEGYAYRLGTARKLTLGFVGPASVLRRGDAAFEDALRRAGAAWILAGISGAGLTQAGRGGACSIQWAQPLRARLLGDAEFAPDALAAQGLALGLTDALALERVEPRLNHILS